MCTTGAYLSTPKSKNTSVEHEPTMLSRNKWH